MYPGNTNTPLFPDLFTDLNPRSIPDTPLPPVPLDSTTSDIDIAWMTPIRYTHRSLYMSIATLLDFVLIKECFLSLLCLLTLTTLRSKRTVVPGIDIANKKYKNYPAMDHR